MYNTVLGAKPLRPDGRAFYYSDYNFNGRKVYSDHRFPCCSGTLPQVAADYGISAYLRAPEGVYVNLYIRSSARWVQADARCSITQTGGYPLADTVSLRVGSAPARDFTVYLRIPLWATGARIEVNGERWGGAVEPGTFAALARSWRDGDRIDLELPRRMRLEAIDARHPQVAALLCGPLVLFPIHGSAQSLRPQRAQLLAARQRGEQRWEAGIAAAPLTLLPFFAIDQELYSTALQTA